MDTSAIQQRLNEVGMGPIQVDNDFGPKTKRAVEKFQISRGLHVDGIVGKQTEAALFPVMQSEPKPSALPAMTTSVAGRAAIMQREGVKLHSYPDPATGGAPWSIGCGHTTAAGPPVVRIGMTITQAECDQILSNDLVNFEHAVLKAVKVPVAQHEFDACVSLAFNIGAGAFSGSSIVGRLNRGDRAGAADAFLLWDRANGHRVQGLTTRRQSERAQFLGL